MLAENHQSGTTMIDWAEEIEHMAETFTHSGSSLKACQILLTMLSCNNASDSIQLLPQSASKLQKYIG